MEKFVELWRHLSLLDVELNEIHFNEEEMLEEINCGTLCLVGKIHTGRLIRKTVLHSTMNKIWKLTKPCIFDETSVNLFILQFATLEDKH